MSNPALDAVVRLLREENKYDTLPSKAVNKLLYLVHKATNRRDLDLTVPYFWYMFGTVASDAGNDGKSDKGPRRLSNTTNNHKNQREIDQLRSVVRDVLDLYYEHSLEYIR